VAAQIDPARWIPTLGLGGLAAVLGLLAGIDPMLAIAASIGLAFLLLTIADLTVGLTIFTAVSFLELTSVSSGVGLAKVIGLALALSWLATVATRAGRERFVWATHPAFVTFVFGFVAWSTASLLWAENTTKGLEQLQSCVLVALLVPIVYTGVTSARDVKAVTGAFVVGSTIAAVYGLVATPTISGAQGAVDATQQLNRVAGTVGDPNVLASILLVGAVLAIALAVTQRRSPALRIALVGCAALCLAGVVLTFSRGGLIALGTALIVAPLLARNKAATIGAALLVVACILAYIVALAPADARERLVANDGGSGRTDIWKIGWRMVEDKPLAGIGVGNFQSSSIHYQIRPGVATERTDLADNPSVAHNSYLELLAEGGVVGLGLFLGIVIAALVAATKATRTFLRDRRSDLAIISGAVVVSLVSILTSDFFISEQFSKQLWLLIALCPALHAIAMKGSESSPVDRRSR
jgi:O-antigen ligase